MLIIAGVVTIDRARRDEVIAAAIAAASLQRYEIASVGPIV